MKQFYFPNKKSPKATSTKRKAVDALKSPTAEDFLSLAVSKTLLSNYDLPPCTTGGNKVESRATSNAPSRPASKAANRTSSKTEENQLNTNISLNSHRWQTQSTRVKDIIIPSKYVTGNKYVPKKEDIEHLVMVGPHTAEQIKYSDSFSNQNSERSSHPHNDNIELRRDSLASLSSMISSISSGSASGVLTEKEEKRKHYAKEFYDAVVHVAPIIPPAYLTNDEPRYKSALNSNAGDGRGVNAGIASIGVCKTGHIVSDNIVPPESEQPSPQHAHVSNTITNSEFTDSVTDTTLANIPRESSSVHNNEDNIDNTSVNSLSTQKSKNSSTKGLELLPPSCTVIGDDECSVMSVESVYSAYNTLRKEQTIKTMNSQVVSKQYRSGGAVLKGNKKYDFGHRSNRKSTNEASRDSAKKLIESMPLLASLDKTSKITSGQAQASIRAKRSAVNDCLWAYTPLATTSETPWLRNKNSGASITPNSLYRVYTATPKLPPDTGNELNARSINSTVWKETFTKNRQPKMDEYCVDKLSGGSFFPADPLDDELEIDSTDSVIRQQMQIDRELISSLKVPSGIKIINKAKWNDSKILRNHVTDCARIAKNIRTQNHLVRTSFENFSNNCRNGKINMNIISNRKQPSIVYPVPSEGESEDFENIQENIISNDNPDPNVNIDEIPDDISEVSNDSTDDTHVELPIVKGIEYDHDFERNQNKRNGSCNDDASLVSLMSDSTHKSENVS